VDLRDYDLLILNDITEISGSEKIKLEAFLQQKNKGVICFLGAGVGTNLAGLIEGCCQPEEIISPRGYLTLDWYDARHPVFSPFQYGIQKTIRVYRLTKLRADHGVIARLTGNHPFIVMNNNLSVVATPFLPIYTDIVYKSAFVPLLHRLIINTLYKRYDREAVIGDPVPGNEPMKAPTNEYLQPGQGFSQPGFYTNSRDTIAVNVESAEGDLKILGKENARILNIAKIDPRDDISQDDLSILFLYLALAALIIEMLLLALH